ncbi:MAG: response regulator [Spirochaetaceae bacterium]|jgi:DNA-binding response OmpR family regulator|nr:response regulator [Spirochaetaceae bacterium]
MAERKKILIAENEDMNLDFLELMLSRLGFDVEKAVDGQIALKIIKHEKIDIALVNTILPEISGWEVLKTIKNDPKSSGIPVIFFSDIDNVKEKVESYALGAEDFITKPFNFSVLLSRIRSALRKRELFVQIGLREEHIRLIEKAGVEVTVRIYELANMLERAKENIESLKTKNPDGKSLNESFSKMEERFSSTLRDIRNLQKDLAEAHQEAERLKRKEIGLSLLEHPETEKVR